MPLVAQSAGPEGIRRDLLWMHSTACGVAARAMPAHPELLEPLHCAREALHALVLVEVQRAEDGGEA